MLLDILRYAPKSNPVLCVHVYIQDLILQHTIENPSTWPKQDKDLFLSLDWGLEEGNLESGRSRVTSGWGFSYLSVPPVEHGFLAQGHLTVHSICIPGRKRDERGWQRVHFLPSQALWGAFWESLPSNVSWPPYLQAVTWRLDVDIRHCLE